MAVHTINIYNSKKLKMVSQKKNRQSDNQQTRDQLL